MSLQNKLEKKNLVIAHNELIENQRRKIADQRYSVFLEQLEKDSRLKEMEAIAHSSEVQNGLNLFIQKIVNPYQDYSIENLTSEVHIEVIRHDPSRSDINSDYQLGSLTLMASFKGTQVNLTVNWKTQNTTVEKEVQSGSFPFATGVMRTEKKMVTTKDAGLKIYFWSDIQHNQRLVHEPIMESQDELLEFLTDVIVGLKNFSLKKK